MKIFGIGLSRTGTKSLHKALQMLGLRSVHMPRSDAEIDGADAANDISIAGAYRQLDLKYPDSKFILTVREIEGWLRSIEYHWRVHRKNRTEFSDKIRMALYGTMAFDAEKLRAAYAKHVDGVMEYFKDREVLVMDIPAGDGWEKLCPFLGQEIPREPFPHLHWTFGRGQP